MRPAKMAFGLTGLFLFAPMVAKPQAPPKPQFEVAAIKPGGDSFSTTPQRSAGRLTWTTQVAYLIGYAYRLDFSHVSGEHLGAVYTIEAIFEPAATNDQLRSMLQSLLADRFKMRSHGVVTEVDGYALSVGKNGIKMKVADQSAPAKDSGDDGSSPISPSYVAATAPTLGVTAIAGRRASMSQLVQALGRALGTPLWDQTGLLLNYDFDFRYSADARVDSPTDAPSLTTALQESLGLTLKKQKGPLETLVVDSIEPPSEN
ncbi:MAG: TIGR03435 family protein [Acidobacteriota bacterium]